jgi:hypothetical protein
MSRLALAVETVPLAPLLIWMSNVLALLPT